MTFLESFKFGFAASLGLLATKWLVTITLVLVDIVKQANAQ